MSLKDNVAALARGELPVDELKERLLDDLIKAQVNPTQVLAVLHEERNKGALTEVHFDELTQFVNSTQIPGGSANESSAEPVGADADISQTRLATSYQTDDPGGGHTTVVLGMRLRDRFILDEVIGIGGMGTVYRGRDALKIEAQDRNPYIAVKVLNDNFKQRPDAFIALQREASRQQRLAHPNIATVYDFDRSGGVMFITMEYLEGRTLDEIIKEDVRPTGGMPLADLLPILEHICAALSHAHERNIVHADFKPSNCFVTKNDRVKVLDFGIARAMQDPNAAAGDQTLFDPRSIGALTPAYASPEMLDDSAEPDPRDDVYALACVTYELLTGKHPYARMPANQAQANQLKPTRIKSLSRRQNNALADALAFEREDRTPSTQQFFEQLSTKRSASMSTGVIGAIAAGVLLLVGLITLPNYMAQQEYDAVVSQLQSGESASIDAGLAAAVTLDPSTSARAIQASRSALLNYMSLQYEVEMAVPDAQVDFPALDATLQKISALFPDSAALTELTNRYQLRRDSYLIALSGQFDALLNADSLLPNSDNLNLPQLITRIAYVDPKSTLLTDSRIVGAYAAAIETALSQEDFPHTAALLDQGVKLAPEHRSLLDLRDQLENAQARVEQAEQLAAAEKTLASAAQGVNSLANIPNLATPAAALLELDPNSEVISQASLAVSQKTQSELADTLASNRLADIVTLLEANQDTWRLLGQTNTVQQVAERRLKLMERQDNLVQSIRTAVANPTLQSGAQSAAQLLQALATIDPTDSRLATLQGELVSAVRLRSEQFGTAGQFETARSELAKATPYAESPELQEAIREQLVRINNLERTEQQRIAAATQAAERDQELAQQAAKADQEEKLRLAREQSIATATQNLNSALLDLERGSGLSVAAVEKVHRQILALGQTDPNNSRVPSAQQELQDLVLSGIPKNTNTTSAITDLDEVISLLGTSAAFTTLRQQLLNRKTSEVAAAREQKIQTARTNLANTLQDTTALANESARQQAITALSELRALTQPDAQTRQVAEQTFANAFVDAANKLTDNGRFSAAAQVLAGAAAARVNNATLNTAQSQLDNARSAYRAARAEAERAAKLDALAQRFRREVRSAKLSQAKTSLNSYTKLDPNSAFVNEEGPRLLANGYAGLANRQISNNQLSDAQNNINAGRALAPNDSRWVIFERDIVNQQRQLRVRNWLQGKSQRSVASVRQNMSDLRGVPENQRRYDLDLLYKQWSDTAIDRLQKLRGNRNAHNRFLADAKLLLPQSSQLHGLRPIAEPKPPAVVVRKPDPKPEPVITQPAAVPEVVNTPKPPEPVPLTLATIAGRWCTDSLEMTFSADQMEFKVSRQRLQYPVSKYAFTPDQINVFWSDNRTGNMIFEFGQFDGNNMTQLRGRRADSKQWQTYNRQLRRCG